MSELARVEAVLALVRREKLAVTEIAVGDVRLVLAAPLDGSPKPAATKPPTKAEAELEALRGRSRALFGKVLPDEELEQLRGAL